MEHLSSEPSGLIPINEIASREGGPYKLPCSRAWIYNQLLPKDPPLKADLPPEVLAKVRFPLLDSFMCGNKRVATPAAIATCTQYLEIIGKALGTDRGKKSERPD